jgi:hypothetical protein
MSDITTLRDALFSTLASLQDKKNPMEIDRAGAICNVAREITATAKLEIDYIKVTGASSESAFISLGAPALAGQREDLSGSGIKKVELVPGGSITTHRMR